MDFTFTPEQDEAAELAAKILEDRATNERMKAVEADGCAVRPRPVGRARLDAGLLALARPRGVRRRRARPRRALPGAGRGRPDGGAGAAGRARPRGAGSWPSSAATTQKAQWLPGAASGELVLTAAVAEDRAVRARAADHGRDRGRRRLPADRQQGDRAGRARRRRCSWCRRRRRPGSGVFLVRARRRRA